MSTEYVRGLRIRNMSYASVIVVGVLSGIMGGAIGLLMVAGMVWLCSRSWVIDAATSHGISEQHSSRLGGVAVCLGTIAFFVASHWAQNQTGFSAQLLSAGKGAIPSYMWAAFLIALVGLWDDFVTRFSPTVRLILVLVLSCGALINDPSIMASAAYQWVPADFREPWVLLIAGTLITSGFVNAGNMADGANGLLGTIVLAFLCVALSYDSAGQYASLIMALIIFLVFNVVTGRIFLGDFGAYGLSAVVAFGALELYATGNFSLWSLGSLLAYPCVEMVRVIAARWFAGNSPLNAGNDHLHNFFYQFLRDLGWKRTLANSVTGCSLGFIGAVVPALLLIYGVIDPINTMAWLAYFFGYVVLHLVFLRIVKSAVDAK